MKWFGRKSPKTEPGAVRIAELEGALWSAKETSGIYKRERDQAFGKCANLEIELRIAQGALNAANAKIERMTSGLRNHKPKVVS